MRCRACEGETPGGKPFCANCGARLGDACAQCGAELLAGKPFCADCGAAVGAPERPAAPVAPAAASSERRLCSVLFVDLVGFTPRAERADPEAVRELLGRYFDRAQAIIVSYGGTIEKFIGDAVMAVWGAPVANEDDAERAVRAGLDVVAAVAELGLEPAHEGLAARAGVVTGEVAVTVGREHEGMVTGDTVNAASRVQGAAEPGTVLVDEVTWHASSGAIAYEERGPLELKGKAEPLPAWRALRVVGQRKGLGRAEGVEPPFVGRDEELRLVKELLHATERERRARLVSVTGVPGIGKSRLAWEFVKYVDGLAEDVYWHQGRSATYGAGTAFGALAEMVRMRASITELDDAATAKAALASCVAEYLDDDEDRRWVEPRLAHLLGLGEVAQVEREELFGAWRTFFERIAQRGVTVLVFEDLQWADAGLIDFIESVLEWSRAFPIMIVTLSRPELRDLRPDWGAGQHSFTSLHLDPLTDAEMTTLLDGYVRGLPTEVVAAIRGRAEGVPLYAVEMVRALVDRGVLVVEGGAYGVAGDLGAIEIPETLHALVASRLDALPAEQRALLQDAAVLGLAFRPETLATLHETTRELVEPALRELVRKEFLRLDQDPRSPERGQYTFVQSVISDVALGMLSRRDRSAKHLAVAEHLASLDDEELTTAVAAQYAAAVRSAPEGPDADALAPRAATWLSRAGERALSLGSPEQALDLFSQALEFTAAPQERAPLLEAAGRAAVTAARSPRALALLEEATALYRAAGDREAVARTQAEVAQCHAIDRRYTEEIAVAEAAYLELGEDGSLEVRATLANLISGGYGQGLDLNKSLEWAEVALAAAEQLDDTTELAKGYGSRSVALFNLGRHREALLLARGMAALAEEAGALREQAIALMGAGLYALPDDPRESVRTSLASAELARRIGLRRMEETNLLNFAETSIQLGDWEAADRVLAELDDRTRLTGLGAAQEPWSGWLRAMLEAERGDVATALARLPAAEVVEEGEAEFVAGATTMLHASAVVRFAAGDHEGSRADAARAVAIDPMGINAPSAVADWARAAIWRRDAADARAAIEAGRRLRGRYVTATIATAEAGVAALEGRDDDAIEGYRGAAALWRELASTLDLALCGLDAAVLLGPSRVPALVAEAESILTALGARPYLERLDAARRGA